MLPDNHHIAAKGRTPFETQPVSVEASASLQEIIAARPGRFVRQGTAIIFCLFLILVGSLWFVRFPDKLEGPAVITTDPKPVRLKSGISGRLVRLFGTEGELVAAGQPIVEMEHATGYDQIAALDSLTERLTRALAADRLQTLTELNTGHMISLGEAQGAYNSLTEAIGDYVLLRSRDIYAFRGASLQDQHLGYETLAGLGNDERRLIDDGLVQAKERFESNERLYLEKVISRQEYYDEAARLRGMKLELQQQRRATLLNGVAMAGSRQQIRDMRYAHEERQALQLTAIREQIRNLKSFISDWRQRYLVTAPYAGRLHVLQPLVVGERIGEGEELCAIIPLRFRYMALIQLPGTGMGKLRAGQEVQLLPEQFPVGEFGYLRGIVQRISAMPQSGGEDAYYGVSVSLPDSLVTSYRMALPLRPEMKARAVIITQDRNLLQRIFSGVMEMRR